MQLSHGWYRLLRFWLAVLALFGVGAGTLQVLGPPQAEEWTAPHSPSASVQIASLVPTVSASVAPAAATAIAGPVALALSIWASFQSSSEQWLLIGAFLVAGTILFALARGQRIAKAARHG